MIVPDARTSRSGLWSSRDSRRHCSETASFGVRASQRLPQTQFAFPIQKRPVIYFDRRTLAEPNDLFGPVDPRGITARSILHRERSTHRDATSNASIFHHCTAQSRARERCWPSRLLRPRSLRSPGSAHAPKLAASLCRSVVSPRFPRVSRSRRDSRNPTLRRRRELSCQLQRDAQPCARALPAPKPLKKCCRQARIQPSSLEEVVE